MRRRTRSDVTESTVLLDKETASSLFSLGYQTLDKVARKCNGRIKIGRRVLYKRKVIEEFIDSLGEDNEILL